MRAPFQVLVFPYRKTGDVFEVLIGQRSDNGLWQGISGGGERGETNIVAAKRELEEEAGLRGEYWQQLDSVCMVPKIHFFGNENWKDHPFVIPEYSYSVLVSSEPIPSKEHVKFRWCFQKTAVELLEYDSNKTAVWELFQRLK
ncbi:MAG: NUDIX pyrophosphatase [Moraxellaceae bacterium]|nr:MAG: NUDIX pyrophosphatase [Moraxellaceae bacterium]